MSYPKAYPVPNKCTEILAKVLTEKVIPTQSYPITVLSVNGTKYRNRIIVEVCKKLRIKRFIPVPTIQKVMGK